MGVSVRVWGALGVKIAKSNLLTARRQRGCNHPLPYYGAGNFCGQCGKPTWIGEDVYVAGYDPERETLGRYKVKCSGGESGVDEAVICHSLCGVEGDPMEGGWASGFLPATWAAEIVMRKMEGDLRPLGLWDDRMFGYWIVGECGG